MKTVKLAYQDIFKGNLIVVNEKYPYRENNVEADLEQINIADTYILLKRPVATLLTKILDEISGWQSVFAVSGWRSFREQKKIYDQSLKDNGVPLHGNLLRYPDTASIKPALRSISGCEWIPSTSYVRRSLMRGFVNHFVRKRFNTVSSSDIQRIKSKSRELHMSLGIFDMSGYRMQRL